VIFGKRFNQSLDNTIFKNLKTIYLNRDFNQPFGLKTFKFVLPETIVNIHSVSSNPIKIQKEFSRKFNLHLASIEAVKNNLHILNENKLFLNTNDTSYEIVLRSDFLVYKDCWVCYEKIHQMNYTDLNCGLCGAVNITVCNRCKMNLKRCLLCGK